MVSIKLYTTWLHLSAHSQIRASVLRCFGFETTMASPLFCFVVAGSSLSNPVPRPRTSVTLSLRGKILC